MNVLSIILLCIKALGAVISRLDDKSKATATKALLDAARLRLEDEIISAGSAAYTAALSGPPVVREHDPYLRD